jgi:hypothetical protein
VFVCVCVCVCVCVRERERERERGCEGVDVQWKVHNYYRNCEGTNHH